MGKRARTVLAVIPARYSSTRLPGKVLMEAAGKPIVQHVYDRTCQARLVDEVVVATDDPRVVDALKAFGTNVVMTSPDHPSGTDRIAEVAASSDAEIVVNVQGCEAIIDPRMIDEAIQPLLDDPEVVMSTLKHRIADQNEIDPRFAMSRTAKLDSGAISSILDCTCTDAIFCYPTRRWRRPRWRNWKSSSSCGLSKTGPR